MPNDWSNFVPQLLAQGLMALRENAVLPRIVNTAYDRIPGAKGTSVDVPIPSAVTVNDVSPSNTLATAPDQTPSLVQIQLDRWKEAPFYLTDKELLEVQEGSIPVQASEAVRALVNEVEKDIIGAAAAGWTTNAVQGGAGGTAPTDLTPYIQARKLIVQGLAPPDSRYAVIGPDAEAELLDVGNSDSQFMVPADRTGTPEAIQNAIIGRRFGLTWLTDQNIGAAPRFADTAGAIDATAAVAATSVTIDGLTNGQVIPRGTPFTVTDQARTQPYYTTSEQTVAGGQIVVGINPVVETTQLTDDAVVTFGTYETNLVFHRDALAFASRPLEEGIAGLPADFMMSRVDPVTGLTLRLEVARQHKQWRFSYDMLYGVEAIREATGAIVSG